MIESILNQNIALEEFDLHFFVDAYKSSYAEKRGDSDLTQDVVRLIKNKIPDAIIHQHKQNVGIAKNLFHAEKTLLEKSSWAIVIEEDVYLQNNALQSTLNLINKTNSFERIGMITISGETTTITSRGDGLYNAIGSRYYAINNAYFEKKKQIYPNYLNSISNYNNKYESSVLLNLARDGFLSPNANQDNVQWSLLVQNKFLYLTTRESLLEYTGHYSGFHGEVQSKNKTKRFSASKKDNVLSKSKSGSTGLMIPEENSNIQIKPLMDLFLEDKASKLQIMELEMLLLKEAELAFKVRLARKILRGAKPREFFYFNPIKIFKKIKNNN